MIHPVVCNPVLGPLVGVKDPVRWLAGRGYPSGAILHFDANTDPYTEQTGGVHTFNHAVLSPQYQRNADGSYANVGAKPAVDVFDGEKWLRSCGAVTNLLPVGWPSESSNITISNDGDYLRATKKTTSGSASFTANLISGSVHTCTLTLRAGSGLTGTKFDFGFYYNGFKPIAVSSFSGPGTYVVTGDPVVKISNLSPTEDTTVSFTLTSILETNVIAIFYPCGIASTEIGASVLIKDFIITATSYPVPYVPPGVTQPASNATTTNGVWFSLPDGSPLWKALTGEPLTLATRVRMGVGSGDLPNASLGDIVSCLPKGYGMQYFEKTAGGTEYIARAYDRSSVSGYSISSWPRNAIIRRVTQVNTSGTQYRVGYMIEGTHTTIQWSAWANYDGSFNPTTLYRLMLGYGTAYPMWYNKITVWKKQVTDAEILEAMA